MALLVEVCLELPFVLFALAVLLNVVGNVRKKHLGFNASFFTYYIVQSVVDIAEYFVYLVIHRLVRFDVLPSLAGFPSVNILHCLHLYLSGLQSFIHVAIAYNRCSAMITSTVAPDNSNAPSRRLMRYLRVALTFLLPLVCTVPGFADRLTYAEGSTPGLRMMVYQYKWIGKAFVTSAASFAIVTAVACFYFDARTIVAFRKLSTTRRKVVKDDVRLFAFAILQFVVHLLQACFVVTLAIGSYTSNMSLIMFVQEYWLIVWDLYTFHAPICLVITCKKVRSSMMALLGCRTQTTVKTVSFTRTRS